MRSDGLVLAYGGAGLDRVGGRRPDEEWVASLLGRPETRLVSLWQDRCLVGGVEPRPLQLTVSDVPDLAAAADSVVLLGLDSTDRAIFAVDLSPLPEDRAVALAGATAAQDVRTVVQGLSADEAAVQAYARGILHWHRNQRFCGACGASTRPRHAGHVRECANEDCGRQFFPRIEPAVIVLVESATDPGRCLLARHAGMAADSFTTLAGFVEVGESLEEAVCREVAEEAGLRVVDVRYQASQAWPFPAGVMIAFRARAVTDEVAVDGVELLDARWFSRAELRVRAAEGHPLGRPDSINRFMLESWLAEGE